MSTAILDRDMHIGPASSSASGVLESRQAQVHLFGEVLPGWRLVNPLPISVERETSGFRFVASDDIFDVYGVGDSWDAAVSDYQVALVEFFEITKDGRDEHSRHLLDHLKKYLRLA